VDYRKRLSALWPEKILGPRPGLKEMNFVCWGLFIGCVIIPLSVVLLAQFKGGAAFFLRSPVDFVYFYGIGKIADERSAINVYDYSLQLQVFNEILPLDGSGIYGPSPYPPFVAEFFRLLARLPFKYAYLLWTGISLVLYIAGIAFVIREFLPGDRLKSSLIFCLALAYYPFLISTLANGQLSSVAVFFVGVALSLEKRSWPFFSGLALSMLTYKPTLLLLVLPMLLLTRRIRMLFGFVTGAGTLAVLSTLLAGGQIWPTYGSFLNSFGHTTGLYGHTSLRLWKYVDLNSSSYSVPGGRSRSILMILFCIVVVIAAWLSILLWKSTNGGKPEKRLVWAATLTWTMLLNVYYPIYDTILVTIALILTLSALKDLAWQYAADWIVCIAVLTFAVSWMTESVSKKYGLQPLTLLLITLAMGQASILHRVIRQRSLHGSSELLAI